MAFPWKILGVGALVTGALVLPAAWAVDRAFGQEILLVHAADGASVQVQRGLWEMDGCPRDGVAAIYGTPSMERVRVVFAAEGRILHPKEDPSLTLFLHQADDHPLQARTLYYFGVPTAIGGVLLGAALLLLARRKRRTAVTPSATP